MSSSDLGLYVHYPYCAVRCPYCDFNVYVSRRDDHAYTDAVLRELEARAGPYRERGGFRSLYFGGGTPGEWATAELARVTGFATRELGLSPGAEITVEVNPGTTAERVIGELAAAGVNRFSLGAQSFRGEELAALGRTHHPEDITRAARAVSAAGAECSIDLIYGLPGQLEGAVLESIERALELEPSHISAYTLTIEPKTVFGRRARRGLFTAMDDDLQAGLYELVEARLEAAGFLHYEISSFAPAGSEAVHNSIYWSGGPYLGCGAGAHSYLPARDLSSALRRENVRAPRAYVESATRGSTRVSFEETLERTVVIGERLMLGLRTRFGVDLAALAAEARLDPEALQGIVERASAQLTRAGLVCFEGSVVRPTTRGFLHGDHLGRVMLEAAGQLP